MKIYDWICKFVNYERKICIMVDVEMYCTGKMEWKEGEEKDWKKHSEWKSQLEERVQEIASEQLRKLTGERYEEYRVAGKQKQKQGKMVNMNVNKPEEKDVVYRKIYWMECIMKKLCKGEKPRDWTEKYDYPGIYTCLKYKITYGEDDPVLLTQVVDTSLENSDPFAYGKDGNLTGINAKLDEIKNMLESGSSGGPTQRMPQGMPQGTNRGTQNIIYDTFGSRRPMGQSGGYADKYKKYKKKYLELKSQYY